MLSHILYIYLGVDDPISYSLGLGPDCNTTCPGDDSEGCGGDRLRFVRFWFFFSTLSFLATLSVRVEGQFYSTFSRPQKKLRLKWRLIHRYPITRKSLTLFFVYV